MGQRGDVEANLAAMDDKLRELQSELSVLAAGPDPDRSLPPARETAPPAPNPETTHDPERTDLPLAAAAADQARTIIAEAQAEATRIVGDAAQRVTAIASQIDDLQRLRDELERSARALVDEYAAALSHVDDPPPPPPTPRVERPQRRSEPPASPVHPPLW